MVVNQLSSNNDFMKIRFESNDDLHFGKILSIPVMVIARSVFQENNKYCP